MPPPEGPGLLAGAAEVDITPKLGTHLAGDACRLRPAEKVLDPLYARALVVHGSNGQGAEQRICLLSLDLCIPGGEYSYEVRRRIAERLGTAPEAVMFHLLQNHSAPSLGGHLLLTPESPYVSPDYWWVYSGDPEYQEWVIPRIMDAVERAAESLEPVTMRELFPDQARRH